MLYEVQLWLNLFSPPVHCVYVCVCLGYRRCGCGRLKLSTHRDVQQLANKDEFCCVWQRFSVHYFPLCPARIPDLSSCLSCKDTLSGPDSSSHAHAHSTHSSHTLHLCSSPLPLTVLHMWGTYVGICLTTTQHNSQHARPLQFSHLSSGVKSVFLFFSPSSNFVEFSHMSAVTLIFYSKRL